ncbi:MAG: hypothetical protein B6I28_03765 [Fusobacteriia bacterium 4572_132]|nr:MAG: hypothetical protein B6I28_03765 [Fusobacteriia bacterium 4572_132]
MRKDKLNDLIPILIGVIILIVLRPLFLLGIGIIIGALLTQMLKTKELGINNEYIPNNNMEETGKLQKSDVTYNKEIIDLVELLREQFANLFNSEDYGESSRRASEQLFRIVDKFEKFKKILDSKLQKTERAYDRFLNATEGVYYNILENLEKIKNIYQAVEDIDMSYIERRINDIKMAQTVTKETQMELSSLRQRKSMAKKQLQGIEQVLSINEQAITDIDNMRIELGNLNTTSNRAQFNIDKSIADLQKMANRVSEYSIN